MAPTAPLPPAPPALRWDIFCRVIDNLGDVGVCWRLATQLAAAGDRVHLVIDDASALAWMAPGHERLAPGVTVLPWPGPAGDAAVGAEDLADAAGPLAPVADIVVEAFGCDPPEAYVLAMREADPVWINLEYLSAEGHVERSHGLPSPRSDGLRKWFFYPGFSERSGGLLREEGLMQRRGAFDAEAWLAAHGLARRPGERIVSLFCYQDAAVGALLAALGAMPTLLLATPGPAEHQVRALAQARTLPNALRTTTLPWLSQADFDHLLWACDLNCVRGEDSLVRALWAGAPFLWQAYPQQDGAHAAKVSALLARLALPDEVAAAWRAWNGLGPWIGLPALDPWRRATVAARDRLLRQDDLATQLRRFAVERCRPRRASAASASSAS